ncbi:sol-1 [Pristionchus pacificus]|uniref:Sol-1 n=1 Tax=Pristionchus pacificus TaxID=54126 RepID=A0A2A6CHD0_PRIPA|nr:sol-1 [Pristionchus pacificus]|eukprot:PDM77497.1 sol-1 [Pristionchus pacificus]
MIHPAHETMLPFVLLLLEVIIVVISSSTEQATSLSCPCIHFNTSGTFHTPDYPRTFAPTSCLLFHFIAPPDHRVLLTMETISLPVSPKCDSFLHVYDQLHTANLSERTKPQMQICNCGGGKSDPSPYESIASPTTSPSNGFRGRYEFFKEDKFKVTGQRLADCAYRIDAKNGSLFSPRFPYTLPPSTECSYHFVAKKRHRLSLSSKILHLPVGCKLITEDGKTNERSCDMKKDKQREEWPAQRALRLTTTVEITVAIRCEPTIDRPALYQIDFSYSREEEDEDGAEGRRRGGDKGGGAATGLIEPCSIEISSVLKKNGTIRSSELVQRSGSLPQKCLITLKGSGLSQVYILQPLLALPAVEQIVSRRREPGRVRWCRDDIPPQLISQSGVMRIQYTTRSKPSSLNSSTYGWTMEYLFHEDWQMQGMGAQSVATKNCRFIFNSTHRKHGELWSVNHPGLYPRNTLCEYIFYGSTSDEVVHIHFDYFDVEGVFPCYGVSKSDYVLFSNYQTLDRTNKKYCGKSSPRDSTSESNYYRLIFETDEVFDGTGFYARYQFITPPKDALSKVKPISSSMHLSIFFSVLLIIAHLLSTQ